MNRLLGTTVIILALAAQPAIPNYSNQKAVLVTGASSGIGLKITETLAANGFYVYAGARKPDDLARLDTMDNVSSVRLDVTIQEDIDAAVEFVESQGRGLWGIVNNAGVGSPASLATGPESEMEFTFDVNVYGPFRINQAFLPFLRESGGRTTVISSISGFIGTAGSYSMSKFAMESYTDSLALELVNSGVHVSAVQPGGYRSKFRINYAKRALEGAERGEITLTDGQRARFEGMLANEESIKEPDEVADAVLDLMTNADPKRRYMVTPNQQQAKRTIRAALSRAIELNHDQPYSYDREELIAILDELLAEQ